ncbi:MAG: 3'-kinase [Gemmatimonadota bacterium]|nr:3'-kinase [Gemmatimonadota bacterium]
MFDTFLDRWHLVPDGTPITTPRSRLLPVRLAGTPAMLKIAVEAEERRGADVMIWWAGDGAARVLAYEGDALLLERALGSGSLATMARHGRDDEATRIICQVAARLHARSHPPDRLQAQLVPLSRWFAQLEPAAARHGGVLVDSAAVARELLETSTDIIVLHGDLHHGNILDAEDRGWLAIDPKGLLGERAFDFANIFCNPDSDVATAPGRLAKQVRVVASAANLNRERLLRWVLAYAGLSAAWSLDEDGDPTLALAVAERARCELASS